MTYHPGPKTFNRMAPQPVQETPKTSWWLSGDGHLDPELRRQAQDRMSVTTHTTWQKANGEPE